MFSVVCLHTSLTAISSIRQNQVAATLGLTESNVSRAIRALKEAGVLSKKDADGNDGKPVLRIDKSFDFGPVDPMYLKRDSNSCHCRS